MKKANTTPPTSNSFPVYEKDGEMVYDCIRNRQVMVFDVNLSGAYAHTAIGRRIAHEFPEFQTELLKRIFEGRIHPGDSLIMHIRGCTLAGLVNHYRPHDRSSDDNETVTYLTKRAIEHMLTRIDSGREFTSGILGRKYNSWCDIYLYLKKLNINWTVLPK